MIKSYKTQDEREILENYRNGVDVETQKIGLGRSFFLFMGMVKVYKKGDVEFVDYVSSRFSQDFTSIMTSRKFSKLGHDLTRLRNELTHVKRSKSKNLIKKVIGVSELDELPSANPTDASVGFLFHFLNRHR